MATTAKKPRRRANQVSHKTNSAEAGTPRVKARVLLAESTATRPHRQKKTSKSSKRPTSPEPQINLSKPSSQPLKPAKVANALPVKAKKTKRKAGAKKAVTTAAVATEKLPNTRRTAKTRVAAKTAIVEKIAAKQLPPVKATPLQVAAPAVRSKKSGTPKPGGAKKAAANDQHLPPGEKVAVKPTATAAAKTRSKKRRRKVVGTKAVQPQLTLTLPVSSKATVGASAVRSAKTNKVKEINSLPKATRKRAPSDLAAQYGEKAKKRPSKAAAALAKARAARRTAEERARLHQIMAPSDEVLRRLARIGAIASDGADEEAPTKPRRSRGITSTRRSRNWELSCGKCGTKGKFNASAGVCSRCGAIAVRV
ncbi:MAG: hypothetical protein JO316_12060 [Abitibacteriaceae bacterium]|nr:hypothetical protein [Abditibacteriaceae bacterium]